MNLDKAKEILKEMTVYDLIESGASIEIDYFGVKNKEHAYRLLKPFKKLGIIQDKVHENTFWSSIEFVEFFDGNLRKFQVSAFYGEDDDNEDF